MILPVSVEEARNLKPGMINNRVAEALLVCAVLPIPRYHVLYLSHNGLLLEILLALHPGVIQDFPEQYITGHAPPQEVERALANTFSSRV
jgi:hypothetical protein